MKMHSAEIVSNNIKKIEEIFPGCITESRAANGDLIKSVDFDLLRQELINVLVEGVLEKYQINWPGKMESLLLANQSTNQTLRPLISDSVNFETTKNIYIEGDNLEVLKLLQESYLNKIKCIYIDPPYNTGNDLIYEDTFKVGVDEYLIKTDQKNSSGKKMTANTESNGRFHSDWLSMIYPRLKLSRNLLREDGVIFISIDDNESHNLKKLLDEIFGESCFVADICVINNLKGRNDKKYIATANERMLMYVKSDNFNEYGLDLPQDIESEYKFSDDLGKYRLIELRKRGGGDTRADRPNMYYSFFIDPNSGKVSLNKSDVYSLEATPTKSDGVDGRWRWGRDTSAKYLDLLIGKKVVGKEKYNVYEKDYLESDGVVRRIKPKSVMIGADYSTDSATKQYKSIMGKIEFSNPKPVQLIEDLITYALQPHDSDIVLDFFSGSATTAHAVMSRNSKDGGNRRFILVQAPEECDVNSSNYKEGFQKISDIGKERIRRVCDDLNKSAFGNHTADFGFRSLVVDSTNMNDVYYNPDVASQDLLGDQTDNVKADRTPEDLLFQVLIDWGVDLSLPIQQEIIQGKDVYLVDKNALAACFDNKGGVDEEFVKELAKKQPLRVVFRDAGFKSDSVKINVEQIFKLVSPSTEVKCI